MAAPSAKHSVRSVLRALSVLICLSLSLCYLLRPDAFAAVTVWPAWLWTAPGLVLLAFGCACGKWRQVLAVTLLWVAYTLVFSDEPVALLHRRMPEAQWKAANREGRAIRAVSLNCSGGSVEAAREVAAQRPDVVLLQETPGRTEVTAIARSLFGKDAGVAWGPDCSIIARATVEQVPLPRNLRGVCTEARVVLRRGLEAEVFSIRLQPPIFRLDIWSSANWRAQRELRIVHRAELRRVAQRIRRLSPGVAIIAGGDFNAPAGDGALTPFRPRLRDTFRDAGVGWGDTVLNDTPVLRFDQVWASEELSPVSVTAVRTLNSDHRMVVCDLVLHKR